VIPHGPEDSSHSARAIIANVDGGARGNPGSAGYGAIIRDQNGGILAELYEGIGVSTNNVAEYRGLIAALEWALAHGHRRLHIKSDSQLIVQQMLGNYRVKHEGLVPLYQRARRLASEVGHVTFEHVRREQNADADRLSNLGMDQNENENEKRKTKN
jgi:probable phosphoglycerate mutase